MKEKKLYLSITALAMIFANQLFAEEPPILQQEVQFRTQSEIKRSQELLRLMEQERRMAQEQAEAEAIRQKEAKQRAADQARRAKEAEAKRVAEQKAAEEAKAKRVAEQKAAEEAKRVAEQQASEDLEQKRIASEKINADPLLQSQQDNENKKAYLDSPSSYTSSYPTYTSLGYSSSQTSSRSSYAGRREILTGPRGGRYYINRNGNKTYVKRR